MADHEFLSFVAGNVNYGVIAKSPGLRQLVLADTTINTGALKSALNHAPPRFTDLVCTRVAIDSNEGTPDLSFVPHTVERLMLGESPELARLPNLPHLPSLEALDLSHTGLGNRDLGPFLDQILSSPTHDKLKWLELRGNHDFTSFDLALPTLEKFIALSLVNAKETGADQDDAVELRRDHPNHPAVIVSRPLRTIYSVGWDNRLGICSTGSAAASVVLDRYAESTLLSVTRFGFTIPTTATITGVEVEFMLKASCGNAIPFNDLILLGGPGGYNRQDNCGYLWPTTFTAKTYGGPGDTWSSSPTPSQINSSGFGVAFRCEACGVDLDVTAQIDHVMITVYFTAGGIPSYASKFPHPDLSNIVSTS